jgi:hypothetical protein
LNKYLPTVHGFDEFFGNLYHLNAEEELEQLGRASIGPDSSKRVSPLNSYRLVL